LSVHSLPPALAHAPTSLIRRRGVLSPKVSALIEVLLAHSDKGKKRRATRNNGRGAAAHVDGFPRLARRSSTPRRAAAGDAVVRERTSNRLIVGADLAMRAQHALDRLEHVAHARLRHRALHPHHQLRLVGGGANEPPGAVGHRDAYAVDGH